MAIASKLKLCPAVSATGAASGPVAISRELTPSIIAQPIAVPLLVTTPADMENDVILRPVGDPAAGADHVGEEKFPSV